MVVRQMQGEQLSTNTTRHTKPRTPPTISQPPLTMDLQDLRGEQEEEGEGEEEVLEDDGDDVDEVENILLP